MTASPHRPNRGFHEVLSQPQQRLFVDGCVQIWPDAEWSTAHRHGVDVYAVTAFLPWVDVDEALDAFMAWHATARQHDNVRIIYTKSDIEEAHAEASAGILLASQDGEFIGGSVGRIEAFYRLGLRMLILAYNRDNLLAGGCADNGNSGLSALGKRVIQECNRVGMLLDGSHMSERSTLEMIDQSTAPIVFSHANPRAVVDNPRNISDVQIRACADRGGVIGVVPWGPVVYKPGTSRRPTIDDLIDCVDHIAQVTGSTDAVAIGTDFSLGTYGAHTRDPWEEPDYFQPITAAFDRIVPPGSLQPERFTEGFDTYPEILNVIDRLMGRGYADSDVDGILGKNLLRIFGHVWR